MDSETQTAPAASTSTPASSPASTSSQASHSTSHSHPASHPHPHAQTDIPDALRHSPSPPPPQRLSASSHQGQASRRSAAPPTAQMPSPAAVHASSPRKKSATPMYLATVHRQHQHQQEAMNQLPVLAEEVRAASPTLSKKDEVKRLAQKLAVRLQYAAFKVERGWAKHSLSEVENLFWRAAGSNAPPPKPTRSVSQTLLQQSNRFTDVAAAPSSTATASDRDHRPVKRMKSAFDLGGRVGEVDVEDDVFGGQGRVGQGPAESQARPAAASQTKPSSLLVHGIPTPPPSADSTTALAVDPSIATSGSTVDVSSSNRMKQWRISPTRVMQDRRATATATATAGPPSMPSRSSTIGSGYTTVWDSIGGSASSATATATPTTTTTTSDASKSRSEERGPVGDGGLVKKKRLREAEDDPQGGGGDPQEGDQQEGNRPREFGPTREAVEA